MSFSVILVHPSFLCQVLGVQKGMNNRYTSYDKSGADRSKKVAIAFFYILIKQHYSALIAVLSF